MKNKLLLLVLVNFIVLSVSAQDYSKMKGSEICSMRKKSSTIANLNASPNSPRHSFNVLDYNLDMDIRHCYSSPFPKNFSAKNIVTFKVDTALSSINLNADNMSLEINSVGGAGVSFTHILNQLEIQLDRTYQPGEVVQVVINYNHKNVTDYAFYVSNGYVYTDCEPQGARKWFPCYDEPNDKATLTLRAKVPVNVKLGSNGRLADSVVVADSLWYTWISRDSIATYLMVVTSKVNYNLDIVYITDPFNPSDTLPIRFYYNPGENPQAMEQMIVPLTHFYEYRFGKHPFEKNGFATVNNQFGWGGMENQTLTTLRPGYWYSSIIAHEYAHQWFGDMITCATWSDIWLNEGFATFIEALWTGEQSGNSAYQAEMAGNASYYLNYAPGYPISDPAWATNPPGQDTLFNYANTYMKGSCVLYMLRNITGDSLFFETIYQYANDTINFKYQSATISDFKQKVNEVTGMNLDYFFDEWLYTPYYPIYYSIYDFIEIPDNQWKVNLQINQTQTNTGFFTMPVELKITFQEGDTTFTVMNNVNNQNFSFYFNKRPIEIEFDPNNRIILKSSAILMASEDNKPSIASLKVIENPSNGNFHIEFESAATASAELVVLSSQGVPVIKKNAIALSEGLNVIPVDLTASPAGVYIVNFRTAGKTYSEKVVITR